MTVRSFTGSEVAEMCERAAMKLRVVARENGAERSAYEWLGVWVVFFVRELERHLGAPIESAPSIMELLEEAGPVTAVLHRGIR